MSGYWIVLIVFIVLAGSVLWCLAAAVAGGLGIKWGWWDQRGLREGGWVLVFCTGPVLLVLLLGGHGISVLASRISTTRRPPTHDR